MEFITLIIGFILLIKAADFFVDASVNIAKAFNVSEIVIGATIVSIGTTLPETLVSAVSAYKGHGDISYGNALGSIICNTALIAATSFVFSPSPINKKSAKQPIIFFFISFVVYSLFAYTCGGFNRIHGIVLVSIFIIYIFCTIYTEKKIDKMDENTKTNKNIANDEIKTEVNVIKEFLTLIVAAIVIAFAANLLVDSATTIARNFNVPESVIGITIVAFGTSLPEFTTVITSIIKKHSNISYGNIIGANLFNLITVSGVAILINPFSLPKTNTINGINSSLVVDIPLAFIVMLIFSIPPLISGRTKRWQGIILMLIYVAFLIYQINLSKMA